MRSTILILLLAATSLFAEDRFVMPVDTSGVAVRRDLSYRGEQKFDLYRPAGDAVVPVVVFANSTGADYRTWPGYVGWAKLCAASGFAGVLYQGSNQDAVGSFDAVMTALQARAGELHVDAARIIVWSASTNVTLGLPVAMDRARTAIKGAVVYYGYGTVDRIRIDIPLFLVRAGLDSPGMNGRIDEIVARAFAANAPWTIENYGAGVHAFDILDDNDVSRAIIRRTVDFMRSVLPLSSTYAALADAANTGAAFNRREWPAAIAGYRRLLTHDDADAESHRRLGIALLESKQYPEALRELERAYELGRRGPRDTGYPAARAAAGARNVERTVYWLDVIMRTPFGPPVDELRTSDAFAAVRDDPAFQRFLEKAAALQAGQPLR